MAIMVAGGAGYIGSHTVAELLQNGRKVVVVDSLIKGHRKAVTGGRLYTGDIRDEAFMDCVFTENDIDSVIHFAADIEAGFSVKEPLTFYRNNVYTSICMLESMKKHGIKNIVFSSSAAVYGYPKEIPIDVLGADRARFRV
jgi:UDP-glucose 4-epimerase